MSVNKNYLRSHIADIYGVIPAPGTEWRLLETPMTQEDHQGHLQVLRDEGAISIVRRDRMGTVWMTTPQFEEALQEVAESLGEDPEEALISLGQTHLRQFA